MNVVKRITRNFSISQKLTISYFLIGILSMILVSVIFYNAFKNALLERTFDQLSSINVLKKVQIEDHLRQEISSGKVSSGSHPKIEYILHERTGMGQTGESYLVDENHIMLTRSRFFPKKEPGQIKVNTPAIQMALKKGEGHGIIRDYRHVEVLSYYRKISVPGSEWVIISEIDLEEALKPVIKVRNYILAVLILVSIFIIYITVVLSRTIANPIVMLKKNIEQLSKGIIPMQNVEYEAKDEIGQMVTAIRKLIDGIKRTTVFAIETGQGNFDSQYEPLSKDDLLGNTLIQMRDRIKDLQRKQLSLARQRSAAVVEGQEKERQRIARELHDGIGQLLTGLRFKTDDLKISETDKEPVKKLIDETIAEVRRISYSAMPSALSDFGLEAALRSLSVGIAKMGNIQLAFDFDLPDSVPLYFDTNVALYRIAQESLNNMLKYSGASKALLEVYMEDHTIVMKISDNGKGFDLKNLPDTGNGLKNIRERARLLGGKATIQSDHGKGTKIRIDLPLTHE